MHLRNARRSCSTLVNACSNSERGTSRQNFWTVFCVRPLAPSDQIRTMPPLISSHGLGSCPIQGVRPVSRKSIHSRHSSRPQQQPGEIRFCPSPKTEIPPGTLNPSSSRIWLIRVQPAIEEFDVVELREAHFEFSKRQFLGSLWNLPVLPAGAQRLNCVVARIPDQSQVFIGAAIQPSLFIHQQYRVAEFRFSDYA